MNNRNEILENSLRCLQHPATLLSIFILLLNDHFLKRSVPSWVTGKLSDFAGLFFFPFFLTAIIGMALWKLRPNVRTIGVFTMGIVAIIFILLKTIVGFNLLCTKVTGNLLGYPVHFALDPTDLTALIMLLPAWIIWTRPRSESSRKLAWAALSIAAFASLATSPRMPQLEQAVDFVRLDDKLFVVDSDQSPEFVVMTDDMGENWIPLFEYDDQELIDKIKPLVSAQEFPLIACDPNDTSTCYRIEAVDSVEISNDSGSTWKTAWQIPVDRRTFVERKRTGSLPIKTYDMIILHQEGKSVLLVALGSEGILRRELPEGPWQRSSAGDAYPTPYQENTLAYALDFIKIETIFLWSLAVLYFVFMFRWNLYQSTRAAYQTYFRGLLIYPIAYFFSMVIFSGIVSMALGRIDPSFYILLAATLLSEILASVQNDKRSITLGLIMPTILAVIPIAGVMVAIWLTQLLSLLPGFEIADVVSRLLFSNITLSLIYLAVIWILLKADIKYIRDKHLGRLFLTQFCIAILFMPVSLFFVNWALGILPRYETAVLYAVISSSAITVIGLFISGFFKHRSM